MKKINVVLISIIMFILGMIAACAIARYVMLPDLTKDISKFGYEAASNGYEAGFVDGVNHNDQMYQTYFNNDTIEEINNWEYKYIN